VKIRFAVAALAGLTALAGVGVATAGSASASTTTAPAAVRTLPGPVAAPLSARLSLSQVRGNERSYTLTLTNVSHHPLTVSGYPGLQLLNSWRKPLPTTTVPVMRTFPLPGKVTLFPGQSATARISLTVYGRHFWYPRGMPFYGAKAAFLQVTLPSVPLPPTPGHAHGWLPAQHFTLLIPGGQVRVVQNRLYETALTGQGRVVPW
jgi:hypothetical protein